MVILYSIILFAVAFVPGWWVISRSSMIRKDLNYLLVFAGTYIFSITVVHLLPEILTRAANPRHIAVLVLVGFFMQIFLDFITRGVEHGHVHHQGRQHTQISPLMLMIGLCIHAFMDGVILVHPGGETMQQDVFHSLGLLIGIILHKIPAAIVLMSILLSYFSNKKLLMVLLLIFSLASPAGLLVSNHLNTTGLLEENVLMIIFAVISGNFLHISTTIYFESSPEHKYQRKKIIISILGALLAIVIEFMHT